MTTAQRRIKRVVVDGIDIPEPEGVVQRISEEPPEATDFGDVFEARISVGLPVDGQDGWFAFTSRVTRRAEEDHDTFVERATYAARNGLFRSYFAFIDEYNGLKTQEDETK